MSQAMCFRPMQRGDVPRIAQLERVCFRSPWSEKSLLGEAKNPLAHYRVGVLEDDIQAYGGMWVYFGEAHVTNVAVAPEYRRQGYGRALMLDLIQTALLHGADRMTLEVREHNQAAQALYKGLGFETAGRRKKYYSDTGEDAFIMWNDHLAAQVAPPQLHI